MTRSRITVRATWDRPPFRGGSDRIYHPSEAWRIYLDGERLWHWYVVQTAIGSTVIHAGEMVTCWHAGIGPGDLARSRARDIIGRPS